eukprot:GHVP01066040.1.p1 GENE.GHVP01066040.1~~GHVP01066040.1.p1  ORF type:complete len:1216 (+),score=222.31 GHVP01066040.1:1271-4918(+)
MTIHLLKVHSVAGMYKTSTWLYGIRDIKIHSRNLRTIVTDCAEAANTKDARDKWFKIFVGEFDMKTTSLLQKRTRELKTIVEAIEENTQNVWNSIIPGKESCSAAAKDQQDGLTEVTKNFHAVALSLESLKQKYRKHSLKPPFGTVSNPVTSCAELQQKEHRLASSSGFHTILPPCAPKAFRAFCDTANGPPGMMVVLWNGHQRRPPNTSISQDVTSLEDILLRCAEIGLEPLSLSSRTEIYTVIRAISREGFDLSKGNLGIPLAFDLSCNVGKCKHVFRDLATGKDVTKLISSLTDEPPEGLVDAVGFGFSRGKLGLSYFRMGVNQLSGILCSDNQHKLLQNQSQKQFVDITCSTTAKNSKDFQVLPNTNVMVRCQDDCTKGSGGEVFGNNFIYSENSNLCLAAVHAGVISGWGEFNVVVEGFLLQFVGAIENGVKSQDLYEKTRSVRIGPQKRPCPVDSLESLLGESDVSSSDAQGISFLQMSHTEDSQQLSIASKLMNQPETNPKTVSVIKGALEAVEALHGIDPIVLMETLKGAVDAVETSREIVKPIEKKMEENSDRSLAIVSIADDRAASMFEFTGEFHTRIIILTKKAIEKKDEFGKNLIESWSLEDAKDVDKSFLVEDLPFSASGPSFWTILEEESECPSPCLSQLSEIGNPPNSPVEFPIGTFGTFASIKSRRFFNTKIRVGIRAECGILTGRSSSCGVGVLLRFRDARNFYGVFFQPKKITLGVSNKGSISKLDSITQKQLADVDHGLAHALTSMFNGTTVNVKIEVIYDKISVCHQNQNKEDTDECSTFGGHHPKFTSLLLGQSQEIMSGSVGVYSLGTKKAHFKNMSVTGQPCGALRPTVSVAPPPPKCSHFKQAYDTGRFTEMFNTTGNWQYVAELDGREAFQELSGGIPMHTDASDFSTKFPIAILLGNRGCSEGHFALDFYPTCELDGFIGVALGVIDESSFVALRIFSDSCDVVEIQGSSEKKIALNTHCGFLQGKWNSLEGHLHHGVVEATVFGHPISQNPPSLLRSTHSDLLDLTLGGGSSVGVFNYHCPGSAFDGLRLFGEKSANLWMESENLLSPPATVRGNHVIEEMRFQTSLDSSHLYKACLPNSFLESQNTCEKYHPYLSCLHEEFCSSCCNHFTSLLLSQVTQRCTRECKSWTEGNSIFSNEGEEVLQKVAICHRKPKNLCFKCCAFADSPISKDAELFKSFCLGKCLRNN